MAMKKRTKSILVFIITLVLAGAIYAWYYPLDKGGLSVSVGLTDYWVLASDLSVQCPLDPCLISLKTGTRTLEIRKDGYFPVKAESEVKRFRTETIVVQLKKIPTLKETAVIPAEPISVDNKPLPTDMASADILGAAWDAQGEKLAYVDLGDNTVKVWSGGAAKTITPLENLGKGFQFLWAPNDSELVATDDQDLYLIDTQLASRKKFQLGFVSQNPKWSPKSDFLVLNDPQNKIYKMGVGGEPPSPMEFQVDLGRSVWDSDGRLIYYSEDDQNNQTKVLAYNLSTGESTEIVTKYDFPLSKIAQDKNGAIYFFNPRLASWSVLDY
jgi:hypothetical protein